MRLRPTRYFMLSAMLAIGFTGVAAQAQQLSSTPVRPQQNINLSNPQVFQIQALLLKETEELQSLRVNVAVAREALSAAATSGDPVRTTMAVLSLDAAEKALKNAEAANQRNLQSLLNDAQKQLLKEYSIKSVAASD